MLPRFKRNKEYSEVKTNLKKFREIVNHQQYSSAELEYFLNSGWKLYKREKVHKDELLKIFQSVNPGSGITELQRLFALRHRGKQRVILEFLMKLEEQEILSTEELAKLLTGVNQFGRSAYYYALPLITHKGEYNKKITQELRDSGIYAFQTIGAILNRCFKNKKISAQEFYQILTQNGKREHSLLVDILHIPVQVVTAVHFYFYQWHLLLEARQDYFKNFAEMLTLSYKHYNAIENGLVKIKYAQRNPFYNVLMIDSIELLDLYLNQLRLCFSKGVLRKEKYFNTISSVKDKVSGKNTLEIVCSMNIKRRYLQELVYCAQHGMATFQELVDLFLPLALKPKTYRKGEERKLKFDDPELGKYFEQILNITQASLISDVSEEKRPDSTLGSLEGAAVHELRRPPQFAEIQAEEKPFIRQNSLIDSLPGLKYLTEGLQYRCKCERENKNEFKAYSYWGPSFFSSPQQQAKDKQTVSDEAKPRNLNLGFLA